MEPLGYLGALLGGYQQGRQLKQNREAKAAQLLRQQQENEALKKYREDSLELQRRRIAATENPSDKAMRDLFLGSLKGIGDDVDSAFGDLDKLKSTPEDYEFGAQSIYNRYNDKYQQLRRQFEASPVLRQLGDFETISGFNVPDFVRSSTFDKTRMRKRAFDADGFTKRARQVMDSDISGRGISDPAVQEQIFNAFIESESQKSGLPPERLWSMIPFIRPNQKMTGFIPGVSTSPAIMTDQVDANLAPFDTKQDVLGNQTTTYSHSMPEEMTGLGKFAESMYARHQGNSPAQISQRFADEMLIDDLGSMFKLPYYQQKYGLVNVNDPVQFKRAMQLYMSPDGATTLQKVQSASENFGINNQGQVSVSQQPAGDFGQSPYGQGLAGMIQKSPLMAQTSTTTQVPVEARTSIPISLEDQQRMASTDLLKARMRGVIASGELAESKAIVSKATLLDQIQAPHLRNMLSAMRLTLDPLRYQLQRAGFDLKVLDTNFDNAIASGRLTLDQKKFLVDDAGRATGKLLVSADNNLKTASFNLSGAFKDELLTSGIFDSDPALKQKVISGAALTAEEIDRVRSSAPLRQNVRVKRAMEQYDAALAERDIAYKAQQAFSSLGIAFSKIKPEASTGAPGQFTNPFDDADGAELVNVPVPPPGAASSEPKVNANGVVVDENGRTPGDNLRAASKAKVNPATVAKPTPKVTTSTPTPGKIISDAQKRFSKKDTKSAGKPVTPQPPKAATKPPAKDVKTSGVKVNDVDW